MRRMRGWYYFYSREEFGGIEYYDKISSILFFSSKFISFGPFLTFGSAKKDAIRQFRSDLAHAKSCIKKIQATSNPQGGVSK